MINKKKTLWYVDSERPYLEAYEVDVILNTDGSVALYHTGGDDTWYEPDESETFYPTKEEADAVVRSRKRELYDKMGKVKRYLEIMNDWMDEEDKSSQFRFTEDDYLPKRNQRQKGNTSHWQKLYNMCDDIVDYMISALRTGFLNINGVSMRIEDVREVKWGDEVAEVVTKNDVAVRTSSDSEFDIVKRLFGYNHSGKSII